MITTSDYVYSDVSDIVMKTPKIEHEVKVPFRMLWHDHNILVIQRNKLLGGTTADRVVLAFQPTGGPQIPRESS